MRYLSLLFLLIAMLTGPASLHAQEEGEKPKVYQLSGMILNKKNFEPVPFATVRIIHTRRGIVANNEGFFSIPVIESDTLIFASIGYRPSVLVVKKYMDNYLGDKTSPYLYAINYLKEDSIVLRGVTIFPYDTPDKLKTAMLAMGSQKTLKEAYAEDNMDPELLDEYIQNMEIDDGERFVVARQLYYQQQQNANIAPTMTLFNPMAVLQLLQYITRKAKEKRNKDLNYWDD